MRVYVAAERMRDARCTLGSPGDLNEALVATGIDAFFALLDGQTVEIDGRSLPLEDASEVQEVQP